MDKKISALIIDQHPLTRYAIRKLVEDKCGQVYEAGAEPESIKMASLYKPSLIIVDFVKYQSFQFNLVHKLREVSPNSKILIYTSLRSNYFLSKCLKIGVRGYVCKRNDIINLDGAIDAVILGKRYFPQISL